MSKSLIGLIRYQDSTWILLLLQTVGLEQMRTTWTNSVVIITSRGVWLDARDWASLQTIWKAWIYSMRISQGDLTG